MTKRCDIYTELIRHDYFVEQAVVIRRNIDIFVRNEHSYTILMGIPDYNY